MSHQYIHSVKSFAENTWKSWSKIELLIKELHKSKILAKSVTFFKQINPRRLSMFNYCMFVVLPLHDQAEQVKDSSIDNYAFRT